MCIILVGAPSTGKGPAIAPIERLLWMIDPIKSPARANDSIHMGPGDATAAGLIDEYSGKDAMKTMYYKGEELKFCTVALVAEELSALLHSVDMQYGGHIIKYLNCSNFSQRLRSRGETVYIDNPVLSILGGVQPNILVQIFPPPAWGQGLTTRTIFVYSNKRIKKPPVVDEDEKIELPKDMEDNIIHDLVRITKMTGPFKCTKESGLWINDWWESEKSDKDAPTHPRLEGYVGKRVSHLIRLCMVHSAARSDERLIEMRDVELAHSDLLEVESVMPKIFSTMGSEQSQDDVLNDVTHQIEEEFRRTGRAIPSHVLHRIISPKVKVYEIPAVIQSLVAQGRIVEEEVKLKVPGRPKFYKPRS